MQPCPCCRRFRSGRLRRGGHAVYTASTGWFTKPCNLQWCYRRPDIFPSAYQSMVPAKRLIKTTLTRTIKIRFNEGNLYNSSYNTQRRAGTASTSTIVIVTISPINNSATKRNHIKNSNFFLNFIVTSPPLFVLSDRLLPESPRRQHRQVLKATCFWECTLTYPAPNSSIPADTMDLAFYQQASQSA